MSRRGRPFGIDDVRRARLAARRGRMGPGGRGVFGWGFAHPDPGGRHHHGPGGRAPRRTRADIRAAILVLVADQPMHGYQIIQDINERTDGAWNPSPGSVYPTLSQLADEGLVRTEAAHGRSVVHLTDAGRSYVDERRDELERVWSTVGAPLDGNIADLRGAARDVVGAAAQVAHVGRAGQIAEAITVLADARRRLYLLLADTDGTDTDGTDTDGTDTDGTDTDGTDTDGTDTPPDL